MGPSSIFLCILFLCGALGKGVQVGEAGMLSRDLHGLQKEELLGMASGQEKVEPEVSFPRHLRMNNSLFLAAS